MQHFLYRVKVIFRKKESIFWICLFPLFLGFLFYIIFGNLESLQKFSVVPVGIVVEKEQTEFTDMIKDVEIEDGKKMFSVQEFEDEEAATEALKKKEINGYVMVSDSLKLVVAKSDTYTSLIKVFLDQYLQNSKMIEQVVEEHPEQAREMIQNIMESEGVKIAPSPLNGQDKSQFTQYFFALLAMTCLMASSLGVENGNNIQADLSALGARRNVAPTNKMRQVLTDFLASYFVDCIIVTFVLFVIIYVFKQDFGGNMPIVLLAGWVGSFTGLAVGMMIGVVVKGNKHKKDGISVAFFMGSSFLGGLQMGNITYYIERYCPIINRINPATLIVNACKSFAVFGDIKQYTVNLITLLLIGVVFLIISVWKLRRTKYVSI